MSSASEKLEAQLEANLTTEMATKVEGGQVSGSWIALLMPALIELLSGLMERCNNTPQRAETQLKRWGPWPRNHHRRSVRENPDTCDHCTECCNALQKTVQDADDGLLAEMIEEHGDENIPWTPFGLVPATEVVAVVDEVDQ